MPGASQPHRIADAVAQRRQHATGATLAGVGEETRQREHGADDERRGDGRAGGPQQCAAGDRQREAGDDRREEVHRARQDVEGDRPPGEALGRHAGPPQRPGGERQTARAARRQQDVRALRGHPDLVAQAPGQAVAEHAAKRGDEGQAGGELQERGARRASRGRHPTRRSRTSARPGSDGDGEGEGGEHARDEREAHSEPAAVGEEGARRRLVRCVCGHGNGVRSDRQVLQAATAASGRARRDRPEEGSMGSGRSWDARSIACVQPPSVRGRGRWCQPVFDGVANRTIAWPTRCRRALSRHRGSDAATHSNAARQRTTKRRGTAARPARGDGLVRRAQTRAC